MLAHWDGTNWSIKNPGRHWPFPNSWLYDVTAVDANDVWAVGAHTTPEQPRFARQFVLHWNGVHWTEATPPTTKPGQLLAATSLPSGRVWLGGTRVLPPEHPGEGFRPNLAVGAARVC